MGSSKRLLRGMVVISLAGLALLAGCSLLLPLDASGGETSGADASTSDGNTPPPPDAPPSDTADAGDAADARPPELPGLIGYWSFDEAGGNIAKDRSGGGHDGILTGGPVWGPGIAGGGLRSDGNDDRMRVTSLDREAFPKSGTFSVWLRADNDEGEWILGTYDPSRDNLYVRLRAADANNPLRIGVGMLRESDAGNEVVYGASAPLTLGTWMHVVLVWDTVLNTASFYVDGTLITTSNISSSWEPRDQRFELFQYGCCGSFGGTVDEIRLYDRALSVSEVAKVP